MRPPENKEAAPGQESGSLRQEDGLNVNATVDNVNRRFCRPIAVAELARQIMTQLRTANHPIRLALSKLPPPLDQAAWVGLPTAEDYRKEDAR